MSKKIVISEKDNIAAVLEDNKVSEFFVSKGDVLLGDVYLSRVDNVLPSIEAAFVDVGMPDKMGFIHSDDIMGKGPLNEKVRPNQKLIVQVVKEPTGHKGPRVTTALSLPGRFLVLLPDETGVNVSKKITSSKERARLKSIVSLLKPVGVGVIVRTEAEGQEDAEIQEDLEILLEKWNSIVNAADSATPPTLLYRDQDLLYRVIREACDNDVEEILVDTAFSLHRTQKLLQHWNMQIKVTLYKGNEPLLIATGVNKEIINSLNTRVNLPLGGYLFIQQTEALTVVDVNSGKFTSSSNQAETILKTNMQAADEIARQLKLRNIGGMVIIDFIDMSTRMDKLALLEHFELVLEKDKAKPQIGQLSDLGLVELTRHRQGQSLCEIFTKKCDKCSGQGFIIDELKLASPTSIGENRAKMNKIKGPFGSNFSNNNENYKQNNNNKNFNKHQKFEKRNQNNQKNKENDEFNKEIKETKQQEIKQQEAPLTKMEVNDLIDDLIKDVVLDNSEKTDKKEKSKQKEKPETKKEAEIETKVEAENETKTETNLETETVEPKKLSRKAKKTKKKDEIQNGSEVKTKKTTKGRKTASKKAETPETEEVKTETKEEKPKKRTTRSKKSAQTT